MTEDVTVPALFSSLKFQLQCCISRYTACGEAGETVLEYMILTCFLMVVCLVPVGSLGNSATSTFTDVASSMDDDFEVNAGRDPGGAANPQWGGGGDSNGAAPGNNGDSGFVGDSDGDQTAFGVDGGGTESGANGPVIAENAHSPAGINRPEDPLGGDPGREEGGEVSASDGSDPLLEFQP